MSLHEREILALGGAVLAATLTLIGCGLFSAPSTPAAPSIETVACVARYQGCASSLTDASTMADYLACRGSVDRDCLTDAGGQ